MSVLPLPTPDRRTTRCRRCNHAVPSGRLYAGGYGPDCAELLGLIPPRVRVGSGRQDGPSLFDQLNEGENMTEYDVTVIERDGDKPDLKETTSGGAKTTAAWLRAKADEIDPPKPLMRALRRAAVAGGPLGFEPQPGVRIEQPSDDGTETAR